MALQLTHVVKGVTMTNAYHKVSYLSGNKDQIHVDIKISATPSDQPLDNFFFVMTASDLSHAGDSEDVNYTKQAYEFMKASEFVDGSGVTRDYTSAVDV